ncbi:diphthine methyl ester synthase [Prorops nasuta]|uniref:diphthine methyl ester synthase n=1 Tax=Prorops nasuta TaxID=863751 RepID=UPI0034CFBA6D
MLYLIGLGLGDAKDITVKGLEIVKKCGRVYLESYTSILTIGKENLEEFYGRSIIIADRELVEDDSNDILEDAESQDIAFLVVGDPFGATTHTELILRAREKGIKVKIIHNASILNAIGCCGLQLYRFGETISIPYWTENWQPDSFHEKILANRNSNLHTLCLLDIKVKEPTLNSILQKKKEYMPPKFMTVAEACKQLCTIIEEKKIENKSKEKAFTDKTLVVGLARVGSDDQQIHVCSLKEMIKTYLGGPLHSLVIPAPTLHPLEEEYLLYYAIDKDNVN